MSMLPNSLVLGFNGISFENVHIDDLPFDQVGTFTRPFELKGSLYGWIDAPIYLGERDASIESIIWSVEITGKATHILYYEDPDHLIREKEYLESTVDSLEINFFDDETSEYSVRLYLKKIVTKHVAQRFGDRRVKMRLPVYLEDNLSAGVIGYFYIVFTAKMDGGADEIYDMYIGDSIYEMNNEALSKELRNIVDKDIDYIMQEL